MIYHKNISFFSEMCQILHLWLCSAIFWSTSYQPFQLNTSNSLKHLINNQCLCAVFTVTITPKRTKSFYRWQIYLWSMSIKWNLPKCINFYCLSFVVLVFIAGAVLGIHLLFVLISGGLIISGYNLFPVDFETLPLQLRDQPWIKREFAYTMRNKFPDR